MNRIAAPLAGWLKIWRTTRYLRGSQIAYRLKRLTRQRLGTLALQTRGEAPPAAVAHPSASILEGVPARSAGCEPGPNLLANLEQGRLRLVNRTLSFQPGQPDWRLEAPQVDRLWAISLHYHGWLYELAKLVRGENTSISAAPSEDSIHGRADRHFRSLLWDWLRACPVGRPGRDGFAWNAYAIATRLGWWARMWHALGSDYWRRQAELADAMLASMHAQASHLAGHLEWDLRANHLLRDAVGLAWAGRFFSGPQAIRWLAMAEQLALAQADEQMLADGGHFERSPHYHLEVMDDWRELAHLLPSRHGRDTIHATWQRAADYAAWLRHPDGTTPQFNDGAATAAAERGSRLPAMAEKGPPRGRWFQNSGVVAWHGRPWTLFWDVGEIGPDYQPGHAHADTLTIEASFHGHRLFVDPGTYGYDRDSRRAYDRSTASHNTVCIDQQDSSEVWHIFRVGRRARPRDVDVSIGADHLRGKAVHDGYDHLPGRPRHRRSIALREDGPLRIIDEVTGQARHHVTGGFLLAPEWRAAAVPTGWHLVRDGCRLRIEVTATEELTMFLESRPVHPDYGCELPTKWLGWSYQGQLPFRVEITVHADYEPHL